MALKPRTIELLRRANKHYADIHSDGQGGTHQTHSRWHHPDCQCAPCADKDPAIKAVQHKIMAGTANEQDRSIIIMRTIVVGGPRLGKSTLARTYRKHGVPTFCGDPAELVKEREDGVVYLPSGLSWSDGSRYVAEHWFTMPGPWLCEGQVMARALRKWDRYELPADRIIVLANEPHVVVTPGQASMIKAVESVWAEIAHRFLPITETRR